MKTNQIMLRPFYDTQLQQRTSDAFFCATDLLQIHNSKDDVVKKELKYFLNNKDTEEFLACLSQELKGENSIPFDNPLPTDYYQLGRWRGNKTRMHPYLFVKFAMRLNKEFEVKIIKWITDNLIMSRHQAGDYYKEMCSVIQSKYMDIKWDKPNPLIFIQEANYLNELVWIHPWERNALSEQQLDLLSKLQKANINLINKWIKWIERKQKLRDFKFMLSDCI